MRSRYYKIEVFNLLTEQREVVYQTDYGVLAWIEWWRLKFSDQYKYLIMTVREG